MGNLRSLLINDNLSETKGVLMKKEGTLKKLDARALQGAHESTN